jgi:hypothetical protein
MQCTITDETDRKAGRTGRSKGWLPDPMTWKWRGLAAVLAPRWTAFHQPLQRFDQHHPHVRRTEMHVSMMDDPAQPMRQLVML